MDAVHTSHVSESEIKSPNDAILSAPRALMYAVASGVRFLDAGTKYIRLSVSESGNATAAPAGDTCLNEVAAASPVAFLSSCTSCQPLRASIRLI